MMPHCCERNTGAVLSAGFDGISCFEQRSFPATTDDGTIVSFAMQPNLVGLINVDIRIPKTSGFLNASAGIIAEEHEAPRSRNAMLPSVWEGPNSASTSSRSK